MYVIPYATKTLVSFSVFIFWHLATVFTYQGASVQRTQASGCQ